MKETLRVLKTLSELDELREYIAISEVIAYDTETTGVDKDAKIIGFSISADVDIGYYVVLSYWDVEKQELIELETMSAAKEIISRL